MVDCAAPSPTVERLLAAACRYRSGRGAKSDDDLIVEFVALIAGARWPLGAGWWSVGILVPTALAFTTLLFGGLRTRSDLTLIGLFLAGPLVAAAYFGLLLVAVQPDRACTTECWGFFGVAYLAILLVVAWEAGLLLGTLSRFLRQLLHVSP